MKSTLLASYWDIDFAAISGTDILQWSEYVSLDSLSESDFQRSLKEEMKPFYQSAIKLLPYKLKKMSLNQVFLHCE